MIHEDLSYIVVGCIIEVHKNLGPGLLESIYEECLYYELIKKSLEVERQKTMPVNYKNIKMELGYRLDLVIESKIILELKSVEFLNNVHMAQILTYLKLSKCNLGFLINFNTELIKDGMKRVVL